MSSIDWLDEELWFPDPRLALTDPDGLLAAGGDLSAERLLLAYRNGIFPWFSRPPILWWSPDPRCIITPQGLHVSRRLSRTLNKRPFNITINHAFGRVIRECAQARTEGTWITPAMIDAYEMLHLKGHAHSFEAWTADGELAGGLYGVAVGACFFGESMFTRVTDASKIVFVHWVHQLSRWGYGLIDCQMENAHLMSLGAECLSRDAFLTILKHHVDNPPPPHEWQMEWEWPGGALHDQP